MDRKAVARYIKKRFEVEPDYPFSDEYATSVVFRHKDTGKWFALCMEVRADRLGYDTDSVWIDVITIKSEPMLIDGIVFKDGFHRAYHMNKTQWLTVELGEKAADDEIKNLIDLSFELTEKKKKRASVRKT